MCSQMEALGHFAREKPASRLARIMRTRVLASAALLLTHAVACGGSSTTTLVDATGGKSDVGVGGGGTGGAEGGSGGSGGGNVGGLSIGGGFPTGGTGGALVNPTTCEQANAARTLVGCEFWPTVTFNPVYSELDFGVVIVNPGAEAADVTISGPNLFAWEGTVPAGGSKTIILPWVLALKGPELSRTDTSGGRVAQSMRADASAYQVASSRPVAAWQFNPLEAKKPIGDFSSCGTNFDDESCYAAMNDASLLLPTSAMTGTYMVLARSSTNAGMWGDTASTVAVTAAQDDTSVTIEFPSSCAAGVSSGTGKCTAAGTGIAAAAPGDKQTFLLNAGDVLQLSGAWGEDQSGTAASLHADLSGTRVIATQPVQVIAGSPISAVPNAAVGTSGHLEETVFPAETWGEQYIVAPPTSPSGSVKGGHVVRLYGAVDGTLLTYPEGKPAGAPDSINAGEYVELGPTTQAFVVEGSESFAVGSFMVGSALQGSGACPEFPCYGDPAFSVVVPTVNFSKVYAFVAPLAFDYNFADVLVPNGASVLLDDAPLAGTKTAIGASGWSVVRVPLSSDTGGVHRVTTTHELGVGVQVMGFSHATAYYCPGGARFKMTSIKGIH